MNAQTQQELHVVFGTGPVGLAIMHELHRQGKQIRIVNRSGKADVPASVQIVAADAIRPEEAIRAAQGASIIYHAMNVPYPEWYDKFPKFQAGVVAAAEATGARLVVMENLYMYGSTHGEPMIEDTPWRPDTKKGELRARLSQELLDAHAAGRIRVAIGRASDFFGPGVNDSTISGERVILPALRGKAAQLVGRIDIPHTHSYVPDVGRALVILGAHEEALGQIWHLPVERTISTGEFLEKIYALAGHRMKVQLAPRFLLRALGLFNPVLREIVEMLPEFEEPLIMDSNRFKQTFGDISTPLDQAIAETVASFQQELAQSA